jgi:small subunit ribosomal protein S1
MSESFAELFAESQSEQKMKPGSIITGKVEEIRQDVVIINVGLKSEGVIPIEQFHGGNGQIEVEPGDEVEVALDSIEDGFGETKLSREKAKRAAAWGVLERAFESSETMTGIITEKVKGGFTVNMNDIRAFLPGSLVDVRPVRDTTYLENKPLPFKVLLNDHNLESQPLLLPKPTP